MSDKITGANLADFLGSDQEYSDAMTSFSPFFSDVGLGFGDSPGIQHLFLHYNRCTAELGRPFLALPKVIEGSSRTATAVAQDLGGAKARFAFCGCNTWVVECAGLASVGFNLAGMPFAREVRCEQPRPDTIIFDCLLPTMEKRDPDKFFPLALGIRVISGSIDAGDGASPPLTFVAESDRIVLAFSVKVLDVSHDRIMERLASCSLTADDAEARTRAWIAEAMGGLELCPSDDRERVVLARAANTLLSNSCRAPGSLEGRIASFPSRGAYPTHFLWDSCFHSFALEHMQPELAEDCLLILTENLRADGKMPSFLCSTWVRPHDSQPPLVGWAGLRLVRSRNDLALAAKLLPALRRNTEWWLSQRMTRYGLIFAIHGIETGWDNTVRLDDGPTVACDMNAHLLSQIRACAEMARLLGRDEEANELSGQADRLAARIVEVLFDQEAGLFWDRNLETGEPVRIKTPACFLPFLAGVPLPERTIRDSVRRVLLNPDSFFGSVPFPCVAYDEPCYDPENWWRGPTWMPVAYQMIMVLDKAGFSEAAYSARETLYRMLIADGDLRELFNSQTGDGMGAKEQGWTAAICICLHLELLRARSVDGDPQRAGFKVA